MERKSKTLIHFLVQIGGIFFLLICFFCNYADVLSTNKGNMFYTFSGRVGFENDEFLMYYKKYDCSGNKTCNVVKCTPWLAGTTIVLSMITLLIRLSAGMFKGLLSANYIRYGVIGIDALCAMLAFLTPTLLLAVIDDSADSDIMPILY